MDFERETAITRFHTNKGKRSEVVRLHPLVIEHLADLKSFHPEMFPWKLCKRRLYEVFHAIQDEAGIHLECNDPQKHECNTECRHYGFHCIRRAFATVTGAEHSPTELQAVMRHKDFKTTQRYINDRKRMAAVSTDRLKVPACFRNRKSG